MASDTPEQASPDVGQLRLTYAQIAARLHISGDAARILVRRRGWFRIIPNKRGQATLVVVPAEELVGEQERRTHPPDAGGTSPDTGRGDLASAFALLDRTLSRLIEAERRADEATRRADDADTKASELRVELDQARTDAQAAEEAAEALRQADVARKARGRWARLRAAWRGE